MTETVTCFIGIGSNMGNREDFCRKAVEEISRFPRTQIGALSSLYETEPMERRDQDWFINCVLEIKTSLSPKELIEACRGVEQTLGRKRTLRFGPRTIDVDLLFYGDRMIDDHQLTVPHPRIQERRFVLEPLNEIAPGLVHPRLKQTPGELISGVSGQAVRKLGKTDGKSR